MAETKRIKTALVSVFHKDGLDELLAKLNEEGVKFLSTGGTQKFIESLGYECQAVESVTTYPSILGGRVKTLHPKVFGGILGRRDNEGDQEQMKQYEIPEIDLVIVDLYPFEQTVASGASEADIIEKIDIGGISLIRAGAKNFKDVVIVPSKAEYGVLLDILNKKDHNKCLPLRKLKPVQIFYGGTAGKQIDCGGFIKKNTQKTHPARRFPPGGAKDARLQEETIKLYL